MNPGCALQVIDRIAQAHVPHGAQLVEILHQVVFSQYRQLIQRRVLEPAEPPTVVGGPVARERAQLVQAVLLRVPDCGRRPPFVASESATPPAHSGKRRNISRFVSNAFAIRLFR